MIIIIKIIMMIVRLRHTIVGLEDSHSLRNFDTGWRRQDHIIMDVANISICFFKNWQAIVIIIIQATAVRDSLARDQRCLVRILFFIVIFFERWQFYKLSVITMLYKRIPSLLWVHILVLGVCIRFAKVRSFGQNSNIHSLLAQISRLPLLSKNKVTYPRMYGHM